MTTTKEHYPLIPRFLGQPMYPGGAPLPPAQHHIEGKSIKEISFLYYEGKATEEQIQWLKDYVIYYVNAPLFASEYTQELLDRKLETMHIDELLDVCMEYGLDPL